MQKLDATTALTRLSDAATHLRATSSVEDVLDVAAAEVRTLVGASHAWAGLLDRGALATLRTSSDADADDQAPVELAALAAEAKPLTRAAGVVVVAVPSPSGAAEGVLAAPHASGADAAVDTALVQLAALTGCALDAARLRERVTAANRSREVLLASVSHDLRNPLNTFAMSAGLLRDDLERNDVDSTRAIALLGRMDRASTRMQSLIEDLLEASRIEARKVDFAVRAESVSALLAEAARLSAAPGAEKSAAVIVESVEEDLRVMIDRARGLQLIAKIVAYAGKATGDAGSIRISASRQAANVLFTARAYGPGGSSVGSLEEHRGGLALLMARGLVEAQRGTFRVDTADGLAVVFTLPAAPG